MEMRETIDEAPASENRPDTETDALMDNMESILALCAANNCPIQWTNTSNLS